MLGCFCGREREEVTATRSINTPCPGYGRGSAPIVTRNMDQVGFYISQHTPVTLAGSTPSLTTMWISSGRGDSSGVWSAKLINHSLEGKRARCESRSGNAITTVHMQLAPFAGTKLAATPRTSHLEAKVAIGTGHRVI